MPDPVYLYGYGQKRHIANPVWSIGPARRKAYCGVWAWPHRSDAPTGITEPPTCARCAKAAGECREEAP